MVLASNRGAPDLRDSLESLPAPAVGPVPPVEAVGVGPARVLHAAGRDAPAVVAGLRVQALLVRAAPGVNALDLRVAHCTLWAEADRTRGREEVNTIFFGITRHRLL